MTDQLIFEAEVTKSCSGVYWVSLTTLDAGIYIESPFLDTEQEAREWVAEFVLNHMQNVTVKWEEDEQCQ